jgi:superfamily II DNA or RNA helicase
LLYWVVCEASQAAAEAERGTSLSVEETGRRGRRGCCTRIGEGKGQLAEEGKFLKQYFLDQNLCDEDHIVFISGSMDTCDREEWRQKIIQNPDEKYIVIATYSVFSTGVNIPNLSHLIFVSPYKSYIRIVQSIGRCLRKHASKNGAIVYDLIDHNNKWFSKYGDIRLRFYDKEKFEVIEKTLEEP